MNMFLRLFARYAARIGYLDGKRNYPGALDYLEVPLYGVTDSRAYTDVEGHDPASLEALTANERK